MSTPHLHSSRSMAHFTFLFLWGCAKSKSTAQKLGGNTAHGPRKKAHKILVLIQITLRQIGNGTAQVVQSPLYCRDRVIPCDTCIVDMTRSPNLICFTRRLFNSNNFAGLAALVEVYALSYTWGGGQIQGKTFCGMRRSMHGRFDGGVTVAT